MVINELRAVLPLDGRTIDEIDVLRDLPEADSVHLFRLAARLERRAGIEFDDESLFSVTTVGDLADLLVKGTAG